MVTLVALVDILKVVEKLRKPERVKPGRLRHRLTKMDYAEARSFILAVIHDAGLRNATNAGREWARFEGPRTYGTYVATRGRGLSWTYPPPNPRLFLDVVRPKPTHDASKFVPRDKVRLAIAALAALAPEAFSRHPIAQGLKIPRWWPSFPTTQTIANRYSRGWRPYVVDVDGSQESFVSDMVEALQEDGVLTPRRSDAARDTLSRFLSEIAR